MNWSAYEVFSLLSGVVMIGVACAPKVKASERFWALVSGAFLIGYAIYVANQTSGTFSFPWIIFVIPFAAAGYLVVQALSRSRETGNPQNDDRQNEDRTR
ncbi:hypothetical protein QRX60_23795 [Amycolatopsis mongoliensis]|uniref:Uncharacterized protein n=1 Tax=Amycolatopsis mongoliensis TaxID=715475 RepID=A0A9Y2K1A4_9PSEU|nr:hypothetical protein [Amycolatopsis sp. 4-36]WIY06724.1 hypothetical protein QRX60_23795 [Amycolatopsis sp. 4-36]